MNGHVCWQVAVLTLLSAGMASAQPGIAVVRGQSPVVVESTVPIAAPEVYGPLIGSAPGYGELKKSNAKKDFKTFPQYHNNHFGYEGGYYNGPEGYYTAHDKVKAYSAGGHGGHGHAGCPYCQYGNACPNGGCKHCGHGCPKHYTTYDYKWPQNMVYPPAVQPAGMVQYPYYTLRGPSDFFMK
ncbi:MAG: hypothetical protein SH850_11730 [Planctomycetaceae bacterium]|nr:hypothetical protein [Planctomycetaceae bacterium]